MSESRVVMEGIAFGESPRWHEGRVWFTDWAAQEVIAVDLDGASEVVTRVESFPSSLVANGAGVTVQPFFEVESAAERLAAIVAL